MLTKSILALSAITVASVFAQAPASASDLSNIVQDHRTTTVRDHRTPKQVIVRDHRSNKQTKVRDHRVSKQAKVRDHRTPGKNEVVKVSRKDCRVGYENLRRSGFRKIAMLDCQGAQYSYLAHKDHALFGVKMNAYSGTLKISYIGPVRSN
jgi:hypothetical protein